MIVELGKVGLSVILDNHMTVADWCCQRADCDGLWYHSTDMGDVNSTGTERAWLAALTKISARYAGAANVVAVELKNEPREVCPVHRGTWGRVCDPSVFIDAGATAQSSSTASDHFGSRPRGRDVRRVRPRRARFSETRPAGADVNRDGTRRGGGGERQRGRARRRGRAVLRQGSTRAGDANGTVEVPESASPEKFDRPNQGKYRRRSSFAEDRPIRGSGRGASGVRGARLLVVRHAG